MKVKAKCVNRNCRAYDVARMVRDERSKCPEPSCGELMWPIRTDNSRGKYNGKSTSNGFRRKRDVLAVKRPKPKRVYKRTSGKRIAR